ASFGVTLCAECSLVSDLFMSGGGRLVAFDCVDGDGNTLVPCGRCRQLLFEHGGNDLILNMPSGRSPMSVVLPEAFGPDHLSRARNAHSAKHCRTTVEAARPPSAATDEAESVHDRLRNETVTVEAFDAVDVIAAKRDGRALSKEQIDWVI